MKTTEICPYFKPDPARVSALEWRKNNPDPDRFNPDLASDLIHGQCLELQQNLNDTNIEFIIWGYSSEDDYSEYGSSIFRCSYSDYIDLFLLFVAKCRSSGVTLFAIKFNSSKYAEFLKGACLVHDVEYLNTIYFSSIASGAHAFDHSCVLVNTFDVSPQRQRKQQVSFQFINRLSAFTIKALARILGLLLEHDDEYRDDLSRFHEIMYHGGSAFLFSHNENGTTQAAVFSCKEEAISSIRKHVSYLIIEKLIHSWPMIPALNFSS